MVTDALIQGLYTVKLHRNNLENENSLKSDVSVSG